MPTNDYTCPSCGETEQLQGRPDGEQITVTCQACGETWTRDQSRCRACGGSDLVMRPQPLSYHPRGNQLAIVGWRDVRLCLDCDAEVAADSVEKNRPVPRDYVSRASLDPTATAHRSTEGPATPAAGAKTERRSATQAVSRPAGPAPARAGQHVEGPPSTEASPPPSQPVDPTARQAIGAFLTTSAGSGGATAMLMLGTYLGASTRLSRLSRADAPEDFRSRFDRTWPETSANRENAGDSVRSAVDYWTEQAWLSPEAGAILVGVLTDR